jgi:hypothetical protein
VDLAIIGMDSVTLPRARLALPDAARAADIAYRVLTGTDVATMTDGLPAGDINISCTAMHTPTIVVGVSTAVVDHGRSS